MEPLSFNVPDRSIHEQINKMRKLPEKALQFGEGNFVRGFLDWMIHRMNAQGLFNGRIVAVQPTPKGKTVPVLNRQDGLYTVILRGYEQGMIIDKKELVGSISRGVNPYTEWDKVLEAAAKPSIRFLFSNTTEAGLEYLYEEYDPAISPKSFPGKLTACLFHRFNTFQGDPDYGMIVVPLELVKNNGDVLRANVLQIAKDWGLPVTFRTWVEKYNRFCNTLVDRIVTGYPKDEETKYWDALGYQDMLMTVGEPYHLLVIEGDPVVRELLPFNEAGLNVRWEEITPYRELKVHLLNGPHTAMAMVGVLYGKDTVLEVMNDPDLSSLIKQLMYEEIIPTIEKNQAMKESFADSVLERFQNPFNKHDLLNISLNSVSKLKERILPVYDRYYRRFGRLPQKMTYVLAALLVFYKPSHIREGQYGGKFGEREYPIRDDEAILSFMRGAWSDGRDLKDTVKMILSNERIWGRDLTNYPGIVEQVVRYLSDILQNGISVHFHEE